MELLMSLGIIQSEQRNTNGGVCAKAQPPGAAGSGSCGEHQELGPAVPEGPLELEDAVPRVIWKGK